MTRDEWTIAFVIALMDAGRPAKLARQVAQSEWATRAADDPAKVAREWLKKQTPPKGKKP
jgi:hypothetical protein